MATAQPALLFSTAGLSGAAETRQRAAEAVLASARVVPSLAATFAKAAGAKVDARSTIESFRATRIGGVNADGVLRIGRSRSSFTAAFVVRTGNDKVSAATVRKLSAAVDDVDAVFTISNEADAVDLGRTRPKTPVIHVPWGNLLSVLTDIRLSDPEQVTILTDLTAFLTAADLGVATFGDMGASWVAVNKTARTSRLSKRDAGVIDVCRRWDQVLHHAAASLASTAGHDAEVVRTGSARNDEQWIAQLVDTLVGTSRLEGVLRVRGAVGDVAVVADLAGQRLVTVTVVTPPDGLGDRARVGWLLDGLEKASKDAVVEAWTKSGREPLAVATLGELNRDMDLLSGGRSTPTTYRILEASEMGAGRNDAGGKGFVESVQRAVTTAWTSVLAPLSSMVTEPTRRSRSTRSTKPAPTRRRTAPKPKARTKPKAKPRTRTKPAARTKPKQRRRKSAAELARELRLES